MSAVVAVDFCSPCRWLCDALALMCFPCICCVSCLTCGCCGLAVQNTPEIRAASANVRTAAHSLGAMTTNWIWYIQILKLHTTTESAVEMHDIITNNKNMVGIIIGGSLMWAGNYLRYESSTIGGVSSVPFLQSKNVWTRS